MCVSTAPAKFASTIVYGRATEILGRPVHVLGYQNVAENLGKGPNAMILPIPSATSMGPDNAIDARPFARILEGYRKALRSLIPVPRASRGPAPQAAAPEVQVFESGSYTVVLAHRAELGSIEAALATVPEAKRPSLSPVLIGIYQRWYPGWHIALCCFDASVGGPEPMLWQYQPLDPMHVFLPGLDAHDGSLPRLNVSVTLDHAVALGVDSPSADPSLRAAFVTLPAAMPANLAPLFPARVVGQAAMTNRLANGDWYLPAVPTRASLAAALSQRRKPPGAEVGAQR
jgi:hypothetical protein